MEQLIPGALYVLLGLLVIVIVLIPVLSGSDKSQDDNKPVETIRYNQNGYHSDKSGYQTGKFTKNNTYNGRES